METPQNSDCCRSILDEMVAVTARIDPSRIDRVVDEILSARRIFVAGTGRSMLMMRALAMRLMQLGYNAFVVGETVTPSIGPDDLLMIGSGSGETATIRVMAQKAKESGARVTLLSIFPRSSIGRLADVIITIPAATTKSEKSGDTASIQPGASLFEQCLLVIVDALILKIIERNNLLDFNAVLMKNHANLE